MSLEIKGQISKNGLDRLITEGFDNREALRGIDFNAAEVPELPNLTVTIECTYPDAVAYWVSKLRDYFTIISVRATDLNR
jgi:hypothetical protein